MYLITSFTILQMTFMKRTTMWRWWSHTKSGIMIHVSNNGDSWWSGCPKAVAISRHEWGPIQFPLINELLLSYVYI